MSPSLDLDFARSRFSGLQSPWALFDNAGGSQVLDACVERVAEHARSAYVQLGASYELSRLAVERIDRSTAELAALIGARDPREVVLGSSTSQLFTNLGLSLGELLSEGDEIVLTDCDHEANITPWLRWQKQGVRIKWWKTNPDTLRLEPEELEPLLTDRTRVVAFTATSNVLGSIHPVAEIARRAKQAGALSIVDAVALAPHRLLEASGWDVDVLAFSTYKVYGPHQAIASVRLELLERLPGINHDFLSEELPYKLQPGGVNHELAHALGSVPAYLAELGVRAGAEPGAGLRERLAVGFEAIAAHEEQLAEALLAGLRDRPNVRIHGERSADRGLRVPTVSFTVEGRRSSEIPELLDEHRVAVRWGDFYARRLIDMLGLREQDGVIRVSAVHYNTVEEIGRFHAALDTVL